MTPLVTLIVRIYKLVCFDLISPVYLQSHLFHQSTLHYVFLNIQVLRTYVVSDAWQPTVSGGAH
jgi:hypothetical protein